MVATWVYAHVKTQLCNKKSILLYTNFKNKTMGMTTKKTPEANNCKILSSYNLFGRYMFVRLFSILSYIWNILKTLKLKINISLFSITWKMCTFTYYLWQNCVYDIRAKTAWVVAFNPRCTDKHIWFLINWCSNVKMAIIIPQPPFLLMLNYFVRKLKLALTIHNWDILIK